MGITPTLYVEITPAYRSGGNFPYGLKNFFSESGTKENLKRKAATRILLYLLFRQEAVP